MNRKRGNDICKRGPRLYTVELVSHIIKEDLHVSTANMQQAGRNYVALSSSASRSAR